MDAPAGLASDCLGYSVPPRPGLLHRSELIPRVLPLIEQLHQTGEITLRRLIKEALRMRPDRLIVGEVREAESLDLLIAELGPSQRR